MTDTTIGTSLEICNEGINALRALETILTNTLWHVNIDCFSKDVCNGLSSLFAHELDGIENALDVLRDTLNARDILGRSHFNETFGETVAPADQRSCHNA